MKKASALLLLSFVFVGCTSMQSTWMRRTNPYEEPPFYAKYLNTGSDLDYEIRETLSALKGDPWNAPLHNRLGELLLEKRIYKYSRVEFRRAVASDKRFYPAWYNLGLMYELDGDVSGAIRAFKTTLEYKPGHPAAHFQLALLLERTGHTKDAVYHYAEAIRINPALRSPVVNPRIVDSELIGRALLELYPMAHSYYSIEFEPTPPGYQDPDLEYETSMPASEETAGESGEDQNEDDQEDGLDR